MPWAPIARARIFAKAFLVNRISQEEFAAFPSIRTFVGDCTKQLPLKEQDFDIVINDASHKTDDIVAAFKQNFRLLKPGGVWIIEDL
jgi:SAM-dependent methyltransferase